MAAGLVIVAREPGLESESLPTWTDERGEALKLEPVVPDTITRSDIRDVPGAFHLHNVLTIGECDALVEVAESAGFHADAPVSLPRSVRHNMNFNWVVSEEIDRTIWNRCSGLVSETVNGQTAQGLNARFRFYRYGPDDYFRPHTDGAWPGSRVVNGKLVADAYGMYSQFTFLLFLSDGYSGGDTAFHVNGNAMVASPPGQSRVVSVSTSKGDALCFPHGMHPQHCVHSGEMVHSGFKYIIRSDILFG